MSSIRKVDMAKRLTGWQRIKKNIRRAVGYC